MKQDRAVFLGRGAALLIALLVAANAWADPRQWSHDGVAFRQGAGIGSYSVAQNAAGYTLIVWGDMRTGSDELYGQLLDPAGTPQWAYDGVVVAAHPSEQVNPAVAAVAGGWIVFWMDHRDDSGISIDSSFGDIYAQKLDMSGNRLWPANDYSGVGVDVNLSSWVLHADPLIAVADGSGGAMVVWVQYAGAAGFTGAVQRIDGNGSVVWTDPRTFADDPSVHDGGCTATGDEEGNLYLAWTSSYQVESCLRVNKLTPDGTYPWGMAGKYIADDHVIQQCRPQIAADGLGGCYVAWHRSFGESDIRAQRLDANGDAVWPGTGIDVCDAPGYQGGLTMVKSRSAADPVDGCLLAWSDGRTGTNNNPMICVQKILPNGAVAWIEDGLPVGTDPCGGAGQRYRTQPLVVSDQSGGLVCTWREGSIFGEPMLQGDLYAARVTAAGALAWGTECVPVCVGPAGQQLPVAMPAPNGVYVFWLNVASGSTTLRCQRLDMASGTIGMGPEGIAFHEGICASAWDPRTTLLEPGRFAVVWTDSRSWTHNELYYQMFDEDAGIMRTYNGERLAYDADCEDVNQNQAVTCADGAGGFFTAFVHECMYTYSLRLAHVGADGEAITPDGGLVIRSYLDGWTTERVACAGDGEGGCYIAWTELSNGYQWVAGIQRVSPVGSLMWSQPVWVDTSFEAQEHVYMTGDPYGGGVSVWRSGSGSTARLVCTRVAPEGTVAWKTQANHSSEVTRPKAIADGAGGVFCAWESMGAGWTTEMRAQHILPDGEATWGENGVIASSVTPSHEPGVAKDRQANLYVSWYDYRSSGRPRIYAQKLNSAGLAVWETNGRAVCPETGVSGEGRCYDMISDAGDGLYFVWEDTRAFRYHIYATHVDTACSPMNDPYWTTSGGQVSSTWDEQWDPVLCQDGLGGVIVTYTDNKGIVEVEEPPQVYAQRLLDAFQGMGRRPAPPTEFALHQNYPNPFNPGTEIGFVLPDAGRVELDVYNLLGQRVATLLDEVLPSGAHRASWNGRNGSGDMMPSGVYLYRIRAGTFVDSRKMILMR